MDPKLRYKRISVPEFHTSVASIVNISFLAGVEGLLSFRPGFYHHPWGAGSRRYALRAYEERMRGS
jgi:hypothetical protein